MPEKIYRVDKFVVPSSAREEFLDKVRRTHALLKAQPGFLQDFVLEQSSGPGEFNFVTLVEWASQEAVEKARRRCGTTPRNEFRREGALCPHRHKSRYRKLQSFGSVTSRRHECRSKLKSVQPAPLPPWF
jgi:hypothetical protein